MQKLLSCCLLACFVAGFSGAALSQQSAPAETKPAAPGKTADKPAEAAQAAPAEPAEKRTTPEERQRLVAVAHKLEEAPLDQTLNPDREWALRWVIGAPDVHVRLCTNLLADLRRPKYKYHSELANQLLISSAAFLIEHPDQSGGVADQSVAGMEGVLKAYGAILKIDPQAPAKSLDDLAQKQRDGKLAEAVREIVKDCH